MIISQDLINQLNKVLERHDVSLAYVFGSQVTGKQHRESDVDLAVVPENSLSEDEIDDLINDITAEVGAQLGLPERQVDISTLNELPLPLRFSVQRDGVPVCVRNEMRKRQIFLRDAAMYHDQYPFIRQANKRFTQSLGYESD